MLQILNISFIDNQPVISKPLKSKSKEKPTQQIKSSSDKNKYVLKLKQTKKSTINNIHFIHKNQSQSQKVVNNEVQVRLYKTQLPHAKQNVYSDKNTQQKYQFNVNTNQDQEPYKLIFQLWLIDSSYQDSSKNDQTKQNNSEFSMICLGQIDFNDLTQSHLTCAAFEYPNKQFIAGFISCNYNIYSSNGTLLNQKKQQISVCIFSMKVLFHTPLNHKRAFITFQKVQRQINSSKQTSSLLKSIPQQKQQASQQNISIKQQPNPQQNQYQTHKYSQSFIKFPIKTIQKRWIWYQDIFQLNFDIIKGNPNINPAQQNIQFNTFSFDFNSGKNQYIGTYRGKFYLDFNSKNQIKFTQFQMINRKFSNQNVVATIEFRYCLKSQKNLKTINKMTSRTYIQNAFSPASFCYNNQSFVSNSIIAQDRVNKQSERSLDSSQPINTNKMNRNVFVKSKFHSIFIPNKGIAIDRQERFFSPDKKLTDQLGYYAHKTLDINFLPTREKYRYSSFGKDKKQCLKVDAFQKVGPGSARYKLPSIFDKYQ